MTRPASVGSATAMLAARLATAPMISSVHGRTPPRPPSRESDSNAIDEATIIPSHDSGISADAQAPSLYSSARVGAHGDGSDDSFVKLLSFPGQAALFCHLVAGFDVPVLSDVRNPAETGQRVLDHELMRLGNVGEPEGLRKPIRIVTAFEHQRKILSDRFGLAGFERCLGCVDLRVLAVEPVLDRAGSTLVFHPGLLQLPDPLGLARLVLLERGPILVAAGLEPCRVTLPGSGQQLLRAARSRRLEIRRVGRRFWHIEPAWGEWGAGSRFLERLEIEEIIHGQGVPQDSVQGGDVERERLIERGNLSDPGLNVEARALFLIGGKRSLVRPPSTLGFGSASALCGRPRLRLSFRLALHLDQHASEATAPAHRISHSLPNAPLPENYATAAPV